MGRTEESKSSTVILHRVRADLLRFSNERGGLEAAAQLVKHLKINYLMTMVGRWELDCRGVLQTNKLLKINDSRYSKNARIAVFTHVLHTRDFFRFYSPGVSYEATK